MALVSIFGSLPTQVALLGSFVSILGGLFLSYLAQDGQRERARSEAIERLAVPLSLAPDRAGWRAVWPICPCCWPITRPN